MKKHILALALFILIIGASSVNAKAESVMDKLQSEGILESVYKQDFEEWTGSDGQMTLPPSDSYEIVDNMDQGNSLKVKIGPPTTGDKEVYVTLNTTLNGNAVIKYSVLFGDTDLHRKPLGIFRDSSSTGNGNEMYLLLADKQGRFLRQPSGDNLMSYESGVWYELVYVFNFNTRTYDLYINDTEVVTKAEFTNQAFSNFKRMYLMKMWDNAVEGEAYLDNIEFYSYKAYPSAQLENSNIAYDDDEINILFSSPINADTLENAVSLVDENGNIISTEGVLLEDKINYTLTLKEVLKPSGNYKIKFEQGITSDDGMDLITPEIDFATASPVIDKILFTCSGQDITSMEGTAGLNVTTYCFVNSDTEKDVMIIAGLYCDNRMIDVVSKKAKLKDGRRINVSIPVPDDGKQYSIKAFVWDGTENQNAYLAEAELK